MATRSPKLLVLAFRKAGPIKMSDLYPIANANLPERDGFNFPSGILSLYVHR